MYIWRQQGKAEIIAMHGHDEQPAALMGHRRELQVIVQQMVDGTQSALMR